MNGTWFWVSGLPGLPLSSLPCRPTLVPGVRRLLLAVALTGGLTREILEAVAGRATVDAAFDDGVLARDESARALRPLAYARC